MGVLIEGWEYNRPEIQNGDTTVSRNKGNVYQTITMTPVGQSVSTEYRDANGNVQRGTTQDKAGAVQGARTAASLPQSNWDPITWAELLRNLKSGITGLFSPGKKEDGGSISYFDYSK